MIGNILHQVMPLDIPEHINDLYHNGRHVTLGITISKLLEIFQCTPTGKMTILEPGIGMRRQCVWTSTFATNVIWNTKCLLDWVYTELHRRDLHNENFKRECLTGRLLKIKVFIETIYKKHVNFKVPFSFRYINPFISLIDKMIEFLHSQEKFESSPNTKNATSSLWRKLHQAPSSSTLLKIISEPTCCICMVEEINEEGNFAILNCCTHVFCVPCAKKLFDWQGNKVSLCPLCRNPVTAWTDNYHFLRLKSSQGSSQSTFSRFAQRLRSAIG